MKEAAVELRSLVQADPPRRSCTGGSSSLDVRRDLKGR
jgi:hypothetical protein